MRFNALTIAVAALVMTGMAGCKTTEKNYREAYEIAKQKQTSADEDIADLTDKVKDSRQPRQVTVDGQSLMMLTEPVGYPKDGGVSRENVRRYNVVVGKFKQIFNAKAMRTRLVQSGYADAMVLSDRFNEFYVVAVTCNTPAEARAAIARIDADTSLKLQPPFPWVLRPAHLAR